MWCDEISFPRVSENQTGEYLPEKKEVLSEGRKFSEGSFKVHLHPITFHSLSWNMIPNL